jgi:hypothetical protein
MRAYSGRIDTVDGGFGMIWTGFAQNLFFYGLFIDGQNAGGVAKGTGIAVNDTGAHDIHVIGYKLEASGIGARARPGLSSPWTPGAACQARRALLAVVFSEREPRRRLLYERGGRLAKLIVEAARPPRRNACGCFTESSLHVPTRLEALQ